MAKVLLVAEPDTRDALQAALEALEFEVKACRPNEAAALAREAGLVAVAAFPDDATSPRFVGHLLSSLGAACPPIVCQVVEKAAARDAALIAGAADVAFDADAGHFAARVWAVVSRWKRDSRQAPINGTVRAQSGRTWLDLQVTAVDATGVGLASTAGVSPRQLVRIQVPLPAGQLVAWGRIAQSEGVAGVRFLGLSAADRVRLREAVESSAETAGPPLPPGPPPEAPPRPAAPPEPPPGEEAAPNAPADEPVAASADGETTAANASDEPVAASADTSTPPAAEPDAESLPAPEVTVTSAADASDEPPSASTETTSNGPAGSGSSPPAADGSTPAAAGEALSSAIGDLLADELSEEESLGSAPAEAPARRWPETAWSTEACLEVLQGGASVGLVSEIEEAPSGETVLAFLRTVTPLERRAFDATPPEELPPAPLTTRCLALRLRCFALVEDARAQPADGGGWVVEPAPLTALKAETDLARAELQKLADTLMAQGETARLRDVTAFSNALHKAFTEVSAEAARLRGETVTRDRAVLLDVAEGDPTAVNTVRPKPGKASQKTEARSPTAGDFRRVTPAQRQRRRLIGWGVVLVVSVVLRVALWPEGVRTLEMGEVRAVPGVVEVKLPPAGASGGRPQAAVVTVIGTWRADDAAAMEKLKVFLRGKGAKRFVVLDGMGTLLATGGTGANDDVVVTEIPAP